VPEKPAWTGWSANPYVLRAGSPGDVETWKETPAFAPLRPWVPAAFELFYLGVPMRFLELINGVDERGDQPDDSQRPKTRQPGLQSLVAFESRHRGRCIRCSSGSVSRRAEEGNEFATKDMPAYLWLRLITAERLLILHRHHLGAKMRDAGQEVSLYRGGLSPASTHSLANLLLGRMTSPSEAAVRAERQMRLQEALNQMEPIDREVLALRHFEELSNNEVAVVLELSKSAASNRYLRALKRLKDILAALPGITSG
jgi:RNA polymerase sigma-70 factor (subfamily 1)